MPFGLRLGKGLIPNRDQFCCSFLKLRFQPQEILSVGCYLQQFRHQFRQTVHLPLGDLKADLRLQLVTFLFNGFQMLEHRGEGNSDPIDQGATQRFRNLLQGTNSGRIIVRLFVAVGLGHEFLHMFQFLSAAFLDLREKLGAPGMEMLQSWIGFILDLGGQSPCLLKVERFKTREC